MNLGEKLINLRKSKHLSQEEVADKLNVSRQTISKWETNQSMPDFDKIAPISELYGISADELLGIKSTRKESIEKKEENNLNYSKKAKGICWGIFIYFIAIAWIMISIPVLKMNPIVSSAIFLVICGVATYFIVYTCMVYKTKKREEEKYNNSLEKQITNILATIILIIYLFISFISMAWHITWIIWIIYALLEEIIKLIFMLRGKKDEK